MTDTALKVFPRLRITLKIIAGRATARGCMQLSVLALLPVWGAERFGTYVAVTEVFAWLVFVVLGVEKTALTVIPRARTLAGQITRMLLTRAAIPLVVTMVAAAVLAGFGETPGMYGAAAVYATGQGLLLVLASVHRLRGHPGRDVAAFFSLAGWVAAMSVLAALDVLGPYAYLLALCAGVVADCAVLVWLLIPMARPVRQGARLGLVLNRRIALVGLSDVADSASISVLYVELAAVARPQDTAVVYVVLTISGLLGGVGWLLLRLAQPATSLRLRGTAGDSGRAQAARISGWCAAVTATTVAVVGSGVAGTGTVALGLVVVVEMTTFVAVVYAVFLLENTNGTALTVTSSAAVLGFVATVATALLAIGPLGAVGAILALVAGLAAKSLVLYLRRP